MRIGVANLKKLSAIYNRFAMSHRANILTGKMPNALVSARQQNYRSLMDIEHRLEFVDEYHGVEYINDAKSTDLNSTWYSLDVLRKPVHWIAFGSVEEFELHTVKDMDMKLVQSVIVLGAENALFNNEILAKGIPVFGAKDLRSSLTKSMKLAKSGEVVLFSPGGNIYGHFKHYKEAGQQFRKDVREIRL